MTDSPLSPNMRLFGAISVVALSATAAFAVIFKDNKPSPVTETHEDAVTINTEKEKCAVTLTNNHGDAMPGSLYRSMTYDFNNGILITGRPMAGIDGEGPVPLQPLFPKGREDAKNVFTKYLSGTACKLPAGW
jgi:hypothetical protein